MDKTVAKSIDLVKESIDQLIGISFSKSSSPAYSLAVSVAMGAGMYQEIIINKKIVHLVVFKKNKIDAARALSLIQYISSWKGVQFFVRGKISLNPWKLIRVIECFLEASSCDDWKAHCLKSVDDLKIKSLRNYNPLSINLTFDDKKPPIREKIKIDRYTFPCSFLEPMFKFQADHPSSPKNQIQACAVSAGCDWCPNFNPNNYKKIGHRIEERDVFI